MRTTLEEAPGLDLYLFPAVVGGGLGDVEEVLLAGRRLERAGFAPMLYRAPGRALPRSVEGPWGWPELRRIDRLRPRAPRALTVSAWWGVSAAPPVDAPLGRAGPWAVESEAVESAYGSGRVLHVSFEEFARTLTSREQVAERWREGGVAIRQIRARLKRRSTAREVTEFRDLFRRFRAFDRPHVLHLYPTFLPSRAFHREFPEAVQTGPFWPEPFPRTLRRRSRRWLWYASPGSSPLLARRIAARWSRSDGPLVIEIRAPSRFPVPTTPGLSWRFLAPMAWTPWRRRFAQAELRIVTGSRTLLEALVLGRPFLYFNGVLGKGRGARRHRPEKIESLLRLWRRHGVTRALRHDLAEFARMRSVGQIIGRARHDPDWPRRFPGSTAVRGFSPLYGDAGVLVEALARTFARGQFSAPELVRSVRGGFGVRSAKRA
jgi:hypothetical protein